MAEGLVISTPLILTVVLGVVGLAIPVIDGLRKERGTSNKLYSAISVGTLIFAIGFVIARVLSGEVMPAMAFGPGVLSNDVFGSFFAVAFLIVSIMVTASSWNYMKGRTNPAAYYSLILLSTIGMVLIAYSTDLVMLLVSWELMSLPTYALAAFSKRDPISNEARYQVLYVRCAVISHTCNRYRSRVWNHRNYKYCSIDPGDGSSPKRLDTGWFIGSSALHSRFWFQDGTGPVSYVAPRCLRRFPYDYRCAIGSWNQESRLCCRNPSHCAGNVCTKSRLDSCFSCSSRIYHDTW